MSRLSRHAPQARAVLRIMVALLFIQHGTQKLFGYPASEIFAGPLPMLMLVAAVIEIVGGLMFLAGFLVAPVALILSGMMAVAYFMMHAPMSFFPANNYGDAAVLFCFVFLYFVFAGPGAWSLDGRLAAPLPAGRKG